MSSTTLHVDNIIDTLLHLNHSTDEWYPAYLHAMAFQFAPRSTMSTWMWPPFSEQHPTDLDLTTYTKEPVAPTQPIQNTTKSKQRKKNAQSTSLHVYSTREKISHHKRHLLEEEVEDHEYATLLQTFMNDGVLSALEDVGVPGELKASGQSSSYLGRRNFPGYLFA